MKSLGAAKHFIIAFLLALAGYAIFYQSIEHRRTRNGPWQVTFTNTAAGAPAIVICQPKLAITNVQVNFLDRSVAPSHQPSRLLFDRARSVPYEVPFGQVVFMDAAFLPGTVTMQLFGHEIELLPRVLIIDRQEHPWTSESVFNLHAVAEKGSPKT